jgi:hypothetical protein
MSHLEVKSLAGIYFNNIEHSQVPYMPISLLSCATVTITNYHVPIAVTSIFIAQIRNGLYYHHRQWQQEKYAQEQR